LITSDLAQKRKSDELAFADIQCINKVICGDFLSNWSFDAVSFEDHKLLSITIVL